LTKQPKLILNIPDDFVGNVCVIQNGAVLFESTLPQQTNPVVADSGNPNPPPPPPPGH
jgi:hypothetical protein